MVSFILLFTYFILFWYHAGYMFHGKPLYVTIAQRKEDRKAQLQLQHAQRAAAELVGHSSTFIPGGYPPVYYPRQGMMYQPVGLRPGWRPNSFVHPTRLPFQPSQLPVVSPYAHLILLQKNSYFLVLFIIHSLTFKNCNDGADS